MAPSTVRELHAPAGGLDAALTVDDARGVLRTRFGYEAFRPGQDRAVASVLAGHDTLVVLPTGGGKSLCFQVPGMMMPGLTVVLSPLISLMKDQVDGLRARGLPATFINSTLDPMEVTDRFARAARGEFKLLYVAPERFDVGSTAARLRAIGVSLLAVDEAHCISEWGHDFRPSYRRVRGIRTVLGEPPTMALTATATPAVRRDITEQLGLNEPEVVITGFDRRNLHYHVIPTRTDREKDATLVDLLQTHPGSAIVYATTRKAVERIADVVVRAGLAAAPYHAGLDDGARHDVQDAFMQGRLRAIVATNAFGMGIDKADVRLVVHHTMPGSLEAYYQEAGRAGRNGLRANCVLLHAYQDRFTHEFFIDNPSTPPGHPIPDPETLDRRRRAELAKLETMQMYAYTKRCRRSFILKYFGDPAAGHDCTGCDNCLGNHRQPIAPAPKSPDRKERRARRSRQQPSERPAVDALQASDEPLFEALREMRTEIARADKVPPYVVFHDAVLRAIASHRPQSLDAMGAVRGMGPAKIAKYGERVLAIVREVRAP